MMNETLKRHLGTAMIASAVAMVAGCSTVSGWMHRGGEESSPSRPSGFMQSVSLTGANEVPPVSTSAAGTGTVTVNPDHTVTAHITATGMQATASHIHMAAPGANGPVIVPFTKTGDNTFSAPPGAKLTDEQYAAFKAGNTYVNVHSDAHKGGEIRAQLKGS
ncbi:MAG TPA: CHRD domain-containing protein [Usitatibacter sp.]|nr:CHRD domain-containing protein [Usitatibacter sp.]